MSEPIARKQYIQNLGTQWTELAAAVGSVALMSVKVASGVVMVAVTVCLCVCVWQAGATEAGGGCAPKTAVLSEEAV